MRLCCSGLRGFRWLAPGLLVSCLVPYGLGADHDMAGRRQRSRKAPLSLRCRRQWSLCVDEKGTEYATKVAYLNRVREWAAGTVPGKKVLIRFSACGRNTSQAWQHRFWCRSCSVDCGFHGRAYCKGSYLKIRATSPSKHKDLGGKVHGFGGLTAAQKSVILDYLQTRPSVKVEQVIIRLSQQQMPAAEKQVMDFIKNTRKKSSPTCKPKAIWARADFVALVRRTRTLEEGMNDINQLVLARAIVGADVVLCFTSPRLVCLLARFVFSFIALCWRWDHYDSVLLYAVGYKARPELMSLFIVLCMRQYLAETSQQGLLEAGGWRHVPDIIRELVYRMPGGHDEAQVRYTGLCQCSLHEHFSRVALCLLQQGKRCNIWTCDASLGSCPSCLGRLQYSFDERFVVVWGESIRSTYESLRAFFCFFFVFQAFSWGLRSERRFPNTMLTCIVGRVQPFVLYGHELDDA